jgi:hypothetical protein
MSIHNLPSSAGSTEAPSTFSTNAVPADDCGCESTTSQSTNDGLVNLHVGAGDIATVNADIGGGDLVNVNADIGGGNLVHANADVGDGDLLNVHADVGGGDLVHANADIGGGDDLLAVNANVGGGDLLAVNGDIGTDDYSGIGLKVAALADAGLLDASADLGGDHAGIAANVDLPLDSIGSLTGDVLSVHLPDLGGADHCGCS